MRKSTTHADASENITQQAAFSMQDALHNGSLVQRVTENLQKWEAKFTAVEKSHANAAAIFEAAKAKATEANASLEGFESKTRGELDGILTLNRKEGEAWTHEAIRTQAEAFQKFGFDKRRQLLAVQVPIREEAETRKIFEEAKTEFERWSQKMNLLIQAAETFDLD
jgi:hypothetical protein